MPSEGVIVVKSGRISVNNEISQALRIKQHHPGKDECEINVY
jgi:hypothetical protein